MEIILEPRQSGKTTELIKRSERTGSVIVCANLAEVRSISKKACDLGVTIPEPLVYYDIIDSESKGTLPYGTRLLVDQIDLIALSFWGYPIDVMTATFNSHF